MKVLLVSVFLRFSYYVLKDGPSLVNNMDIIIDWFICHVVYMHVWNMKSNAKNIFVQCVALKLLFSGGPSKPLDVPSDIKSRHYLFMGHLQDVYRE